MDFKQLQTEQEAWQNRNFGPCDGNSHRCLLGVTEELGELSHAHLKSEQGIRTNQDHNHAKKDAVGDIVIYLAGYCNDNDLSLDECITMAWDEVKQRDWTKNKKNGVDNG